MTNLTWKKEIITFLICLSESLRSRVPPAIIDSLVFATAKPAATAAFLYSRADRKRLLLIGRDLKCVAFALTATTRACGSRLAHFATVLTTATSRRNIGPTRGKFQRAITRQTERSAFEDLSQPRLLSLIDPTISNPITYNTFHHH